jgi:NAD(P)-dependent dehydrogenase (short-subunit alcohol dehydrogenase family)
MPRRADAALPSLTRRAGAIVTVTSINATLPTPTVVDYSAARAARLSVFKPPARDLGPQGMRMNTVSPGPVATNMWRGGGRGRRGR